MSGPVKNRVGTNIRGNEYPGFGDKDTCVTDKIIVMEFNSSFLAISSKREARIFFNNLKQMHIISLCNSVDEPRWPYTK